MNGNNDTFDLPDTAAAATQIRRREYKERCDKAKALRDSGKWEEALAEYTACRPFYPDDTLLLLAIARCLSALQRYEEALPFAIESTDYDPVDPYAWDYQGYLLFKTDDIEGALEAYRRSIAVAPWYASGYAGLCSTLLYQSDKVETDKETLLEEAEQHGRRAVSLDPDPAKYWEDLAMIRERLGRNPEAYRAWLVAAKRHYSSGKESEARAKSAVQGMSYAGRRVGELGDWTSASRILEQAAELTPDDYKLIANLAYSYSQGNQYTKAAQTYETALALPDLPDQERQNLQGRAGIAWAKARNFDAARPLLEKSREANPKDALVIWWIGAILHRSGDPEAGAKYRIEALDLDPSFSAYSY